MSESDSEVLARLDAALATEGQALPTGDAAWERATRFFVTGDEADLPSRAADAHERDNGLRDLVMARALALESLWGLSTLAAPAAAELAHDTDTSSPSNALLAAFVQACLELVVSDPQPDEAVHDASGMDAHAPLARLRAQLDAVRALAQLEWGVYREALRLARRASLRAQSDLRFSDAAVAHLALARLRRADGRMHLAARIALSVLARAGVHSRAWASYEAALAAGASAWPPDAMPRGFGTAARTSILAAARGDVHAFAAAQAELVLSLDPAPWLSREAETLVALLAGDTSHPLAGPFLRLEVNDVMNGLQWLPPIGARDETLAWIELVPEGPARRVLSAAIGLASAEKLAVDGRGGRSAATVSALACAGGRLAVPALFHEVYGFAFDPALHGNLLRVALHRARAWLAKAGRIEREGDEIVLAMDRAVLVPDTTVEARLADKVLQSLSASPGRRASQIAEALGVPLRTVQRELEILVEEGSLRAERDGANVGYRVIDTVYSATGVTVEG